MFNVLEDKPCNNFIGTWSCRGNLELISNPGQVFPHKLTEADRSVLFEGLDGILPEVYFEKIWEMIYGRYQIYENRVNHFSCGIGHATL